ncbi:MAG: hypothetical protein M1435_02075 [Actinobacteria bacterium]|nr:hypothetical protein [Actinomycetota bacterium]
MEVPAGGLTVVGGPAVVVVVVAGAVVAVVAGAVVVDAVVVDAVVVGAVVVGAVVVGAVVVGAVVVGAVVVVVEAVVVVVVVEVGAGLIVEVLATRERSVVVDRAVDEGSSVVLVSCLRTPALVVLALSVEPALPTDSLGSVVAEPGVARVAVRPGSPAVL